MKLIVIGAGASGVVAGISHKRNHPNDDVLIIEHLDKPLKKILATGNGKCNLGNNNIDFFKYNNPGFAEQIIRDYDYKSFFESISIQTKLNGDLAYPVSESAVSVRDALLNECKKLGIVINTEETLIDYLVGDKIVVMTNKNEYCCDKLVLSGGLCSSPKLGSDGSLLPILAKHKYQIIDTVPGLTPIFTKEKTKTIDGIRCKSNVTLLDQNKIIHQESGEVLFKEHGLSGIVIFNISSVIARNHNKPFKILIDLLPDFTNEYLIKYYHSHNINEFLQAFVNPKIGQYLKDRYSDDLSIVEATKALEFTFDKSYGFDNSQVTVGGINVSEVNNNMMSKHENNVYLTGELLNIDGPCGGYNLTWAFASALRIK